MLCVSIGAGKLQSAIKRQIRSLGLEENIMLIGRKLHECGKPFVGTNVGGVPEVITSEDYGLFIDPADPEDLAEKMLVALDREWDHGTKRKYSYMRSGICERMFRRG